MAIPKYFTYEGNIYRKVTPGKKLFQSTMVHEVVNRGDVFAVRLKDSLLTIIPGTAQITVIEYIITDDIKLDA